MERTENEKIAMVYVEECAGSHSVDLPRKRWVNNMKDCLKKKRFGCQENGA